MTAPGQTRAGGEKRGNSTDRAHRKVWMLFEFGNGEYVRCTHCGRVLDYDTVEADRIVPGGSYGHSNVQPACRKCNAERSNDVTWTFSISVTLKG
jgi:5-methylcytosine-specific restriction endonuclease McrA